MTSNTTPAGYEVWGEYKEAYTKIDGKWRLVLEANIKLNNKWNI